ncbi:unnamed protein product, partial [Musa textilis]
GIDVAPEVITSVYWMSSRRFGRLSAGDFVRRASGQEVRSCAMDIEVAEVNRRLGNKPLERAMCRRIGRSANQ